MLLTCSLNKGRTTCSFAQDYSNYLPFSLHPFLQLQQLPFLQLLQLLICILLPSVSLTFDTPPPPLLGWTSWEWILRMPILVRRLENWFNFKDFVKRSANWDCVLMSMSFITLACTLSLTLWQSISMCFLRSWNTVLVPIWIVANYH